MANEKRLIDANKISYHKSGFPKGDDYDSRLDWAFREDIDKLPTVDAVEVVHGDWAVITDDCIFDVIYQCSVCKEEFVTNDGTPAENLWHYCPNCGAKMDGGNEDV